MHLLDTPARNPVWKMRVRAKKMHLSAMLRAPLCLEDARPSQEDARLARTGGRVGQRDASLRPVGAPLSIQRRTFRPEASDRPREGTTGRTSPPGAARSRCPGQLEGAPSNAREVRALAWHLAFRGEGPGSYGRQPPSRGKDDVGPRQRQRRRGLPDDGGAQGLEQRAPRARLIIKMKGGSARVSRASFNSPDAGAGGDRERVEAWMTEGGCPQPAPTRRA